MTGTPTSSPFRPSGEAPPHVKMLVWGASGVGKTYLALQFPRVGLLDQEDGANHYGDRFDFSVLRPRSCDEVVAAVDWLHENPGTFDTVVVDPISVYWDALQRKWSNTFLLRNRGAAGHRHEFFDLGPKEWATIKADWREFLRKLLSLEAHVVVCAREKPLYADSGFMRVVGVTPDAEKSLPYHFDVVLQLSRDDDGRFTTTVRKDRSGKLPTEPFPTSFEALKPLLADSRTTTTAGSEPGKE